MQSPPVPDYCPEKIKPGGCQLHNLHCGYPDCNKPRRPKVCTGFSDNLEYVQRINHRVADYLFPRRITQGMFLKLYEEVGELVADPSSGEEAADILIMVLDHMSRHGINAGEAILAKLEKNLNRSWDQNMASGVYYHKESE